MCVMSNIGKDGVELGHTIFFSYVVPFTDKFYIGKLIKI